MDGEVILGPSPLPAMLADSSPNPDAYVFRCHSNSMAVFFGLYFAYRIQGPPEGSLGKSGKCCREDPVQPQLEIFVAREIT